MELEENKQKTFRFVQINTASIENVFPLLCPVREKDWIDGWNYQMIYSESGLIEKDCVFITTHHGTFESVWYVTQYDKETHQIEFIRVTPNENTVRIHIRLEKINDTRTKSHLSYRYTLLNNKSAALKMAKLEQSFSASMLYWERALNHYLQTGAMLKR